MGYVLHCGSTQGFYTMARMKGLTSKRVKGGGLAWYTRRRVPSGLRWYYSKGEIWIPIKSRDRTEKEAESAENWARLSRDFARLRSDEVLTDDQISQLEGFWRTSNFAGFEPHEIFPYETTGMLARDVKGFLECERGRRPWDQIQIGDVHFIENIVDTTILTNLIKPGGRDEDRLINECKRQHERMWFAYDWNEPKPRPLGIEFRNQAENAMLPGSNRKNPIRSNCEGRMDSGAEGYALLSEPVQGLDCPLSEVVTRWKLKQAPTKKSAEEGARMIRYLTDWLGDDALRVGNLTHRLLMEFRNDYLHFPKSISNKDKGRPFPEILEPYRDDQHETGFSDDYATISRTTVNKGLGLLQAIFAVVLGDAPINPARNLKVEVEQNFHPRRCVRLPTRKNDSLPNRLVG